MILIIKKEILMLMTTIKRMKKNDNLNMINCFKKIKLYKIIYK